MSDLSKQNASTLNWAMRGAVGALFTVLGILYWNERGARIDLVSNIKEVNQEVLTIERELQDFQKEVIKTYISTDEYAKNTEILLNINSNISDVIERLIKLETKFEIKEVQ